MWYIVLILRLVLVLGGFTLLNFLEGAQMTRWGPFLSITFLSYFPFFPSIHKPAMLPPPHPLEIVTKGHKISTCLGWMRMKCLKATISRKKGTMSSTWQSQLSILALLSKPWKFPSFSFLFVCGGPRSIWKAGWCILPQPVNGLGLCFGAKCVYLLHCGFFYCVFYCNAAPFPPR